MSERGLGLKQPTWHQIFIRHLNPLIGLSYFTCGTNEVFSIFDLFYAGYYLSGLNSQSEQTRSCRVGDENTSRLRAVLHKLERTFHYSTVWTADQRILELLLQFQKESWDKKKETDELRLSNIHLVLILHASSQRLWPWEMFGHNGGTICLEREITPWGCMEDSVLLFTLHFQNAWEKQFMGWKLYFCTWFQMFSVQCGRKAWLWVQSGLVTGDCGYTREQRTEPRTWNGSNF